MPGAVIAFDQARPGPTTSFGSPGVARKDLWLGRVVTARSTTSGNISYAWTFLDKPPGSAATFATPTAANGTFTPDLAGSYRVMLVTNGGGPGNVQILIAAATFDNAGVLTRRGWRIPAFGEVAGEGNFAGQLRGWAEAFDFIYADILGALDTTPSEIVFGAAVQVSTSNTFARIGARSIDMSLYPQTSRAGLTRTLKFVADLEIGGAAVSAEVKLTNVTDAQDITGTSLVGSSVVNQEQTSAVLAVGSAAGNVRSDHVAQYQVYLRMNGGVQGIDQVTCTNARILVSYA